MRNMQLKVIHFYRSEAMKSSIKTYSAKSRRITGLAKLGICTTVVISLVFTANLSALPTPIVLDADTPATGSNLVITPLVTPYGDITFSGELFAVSTTPVDSEFIAAGASGNVFNIIGPPGNQTAELFFGFDVESIEFIYGGNAGDILVEARDIGGGVVDSFSQASTFIGQPAGPTTLSGSGIRSLYWTDTWPDMDYAALDNITLTVPEPATIALLGLGGLSLLQRRKK
jgi:hypothetical protein